MEEWTYVMPHSSSAARNEQGPVCLRIDNCRRCPMALGGLAPR